jgi:hypothetical protein
VVLTIDLTVALLPVKVDVGPIAPHGAGAELDLTLIAGLLVILLACPHTPYELTPPRRSASPPRWGRSRRLKWGSANYSPYSRNWAQGGSQKFTHRSTS